MLEDVHRGSACFRAPVDVKNCRPWVEDAHHCPDGTAIDEEEGDLTRVIASDLLTALRSANPHSKVLNEKAMMRRLVFGLTHSSTISANTIAVRLVDFTSATGIEFWKDSILTNEQKIWKNSSSRSTMLGSSLAMEWGERLC
jgi:hypothetical protein